MAASFAFDRFVLDTGDRRLKADGEPVELNGRYFDALALLVADQGKLVSKDRFLAEVWRGVPVTDEALTQCIRTLRRQLGDDAGRPKFIETVPKHGYRFIEPVEVLGGEARRATATAARDDPWRRFLLVGGWGTAGGAVGGAIGGLAYGLAGASQATPPGTGTISVLLVLLCLTMFVGIVGAAGVSFAIATSEIARSRSWQWLTLAGAAGGLFVGALGKLLGLDAFTLLVGHSPAEITGAMEGLILGATVGLATFFGGKAASIGRAMGLAAALGALAGTAIALLGGRLMLGSMAILTHGFPQSRLRVDHFGRYFGESGFGPTALTVTAALEGALFTCCVVGAIVFAQRRLGTDA
ncbi:MAG TPA: winged helix-turn-helix domain-containing protein [Sphingomicrobium sp.]|nr:winged helix-turn-helix domain-containing protein [Sphingomicrobium sp.]